MATFRCKRSGNTISFMLESDIQGMRKHEGYEEVIENGTSKEIETRSEGTVGNSDYGTQDERQEERKDDAGNEEEKRQVLKKRGRKPNNS